MNVLLVGSGGREHALAWKIAQSPLLNRLVAAPGNPGIETLAECCPVRVDDVPGLLALAQEIAADLVVVGPEAALAAGLADALAEAGIACFGPTRAAAQLETSKAFTKAFAARHGVPTARHETFTDAEAAKAALARFDNPYVLKASGLAAGKGVVIAETEEEASAALDELFGGKFGAAGEEVVVEDFLFGREASLFALSDGETVIPFGSARDHKRALDGDQGPNTGGMGTYSPALDFTYGHEGTAMARIVEPTVAGMAGEGTPYRGVLFAGLMLTDSGPQLIEFNARFGDPECQVLMLRLESDLVPYLQAAATGGLANLPPPRWRSDAAVCVVLAAKGYPEAPVSGGVIEGAEADFGEDVFVFHAGTARREDGALVASGGRVLNVCARGASIEDARTRAYTAMLSISLPGGRFRTDIGAA
jgi:phosphoribosylamine---glycine ligase